MFFILDPKLNSTPLYTSLPPGVLYTTESASAATVAAALAQQHRSSQHELNLLLVIDTLPLVPAALEKSAHREKRGEEET